MKSHTPKSLRQQAFAACGLQVFERGWLSSNAVLFARDPEPLLIDSGYASHSEQTVALVRQALGERPLSRLFNTHLHSDHCGGNAALQAAYPGVWTAIAASEMSLVQSWDTQRLSYAATGQRCEPFVAHWGLLPGETFQATGWSWQVHAAPGHDPHSLLFFQPEHRILISADALWENGFGVVFPELEGEPGFAQVGATLDLIESLQPLHIIPGHGAPFSDLGTALEKSRQRLRRFVQAPELHERHALKVLLKFKLLEWQQIGQDELLRWAADTPYLHRRTQDMDSAQSEAWVLALIDELCQVGAARWDQRLLHNR